jgi:hypothetical protein
LGRALQDDVIENCELGLGAGEGHSCFVGLGMMIEDGPNGWRRLHKLVLRHRDLVNKDVDAGSKFYQVFRKLRIA